MVWTDRIRLTKIVLSVVALVIAAASLLVSHRLTRDLETEEHNKMGVWAEAMRSLNMADENTDLNLVLKVIDENHTIPVVVLTSDGKMQICRNLPIDAKTHADSINYVEREGKRMLSEGKYVRIALGDTAEDDYIDVCYDESTTLKRLAVYPFIQLGAVLVFAVIAIFALLTSKRAEQNKVWVGLSKETAHQLGTPISSLMAWMEVLRETYPHDALIPEMENDINRLQLVADRFSKIGAMPEHSLTSLNLLIAHVADYMNRRTAKSIGITTELPPTDVMASVNASLFEWVIENLCKNAVDAMGGTNGRITLRLISTERKTIIEVQDTGKGIRKKDVKNVFRPGFTTKKRGWGLGLSLAKRIVEEYHHGRIYVKWSEVGKGTIFRVEL